METTHYRPEAGDIVFFRDSFGWNPMSWLATLIRWIAGIKYNHVGVVAVDGNDYFIVEAIGRGIVSRPLFPRLQNRKVKIRRLKTPLPTVSGRAFSMVGAKYDFAGLLWYQLLFHLVGDWFGYKSPEKAARKFYCYEFAAWCVGWVNWWMVNPKEFLNSDLFADIYEN